MRLATLRTSTVRIDDSAAGTIIDGFADLSALLNDPNWESLAHDASGATIDLADADYAPVLPSPGKIVCVGLNYATHITEMGRDLPQYPTLFAKFAEALTGPYDDVVVPGYAAAELDWEAELAVVVGARAYQVAEADAELADLKSALKARLGREPRLNAKVDPALLGGLVVKVGSRMIDSSLRTKLAGLRAAMKGH